MKKNYETGRNMDPPDSEMKQELSSQLLLCTLAVSSSDFFMMETGFLRYWLLAQNTLRGSCTISAIVNFITTVTDAGGTYLLIHRPLARSWS